MKVHDCDTCIKRVGWIGLFASLGTAIFTITIGYYVGSKALMATSLCAMLDTVSAVTILLGLHLSGKNALDLEHPYGHGKIEFVIGGAISLFLVITALVLGYHSLVSLYHGEPGPHHWITLAAAAIATTVNEIKHRYTKCVGLHFNSPSILTHAEHARIDAISSSAVVVAVFATRIGLHFVDPLIAIFEVGHIIKASIKMLGNSAKSLMDVSVPSKKRMEIRDIVESIKGIRRIDFIKARQTGPDIWIEMSIFIDPKLSIFEGKTIASNVENHLFNKIDHIGNVEVQFLPETN